MTRHHPITSWIRAAAVAAIGGVAVIACSGPDGDPAALELRPLADEEVCALATVDDLPGDEIRLVPGSSSFAAGPDDDPRPATASCSWVGDGQATASLVVLHAVDFPSLPGTPLTEFVWGDPVDDHPLLNEGAVDQLVLTGPDATVGSGALATDSTVVIANAHFFVADGSALGAAFIDAVLRRWLEAAQT